MMFRPEDARALRHRRRCGCISNRPGYAPCRSRARPSCRSARMDGRRGRRHDFRRRRGISGGDGNRCPAEFAKAS
jgi:hypothetical protein